MDHWNEYLFRSLSEATLRGWARRLRLFRFCRAIGGHANDGDSLDVAYRYHKVEELENFFGYLGIPLVHFGEKPPQPKIGVSYPGKELSKFAWLIPETEWIQQPGQCLIAGQNAHAWCERDTIRISLSEDYYVTEAQVEAAEAIEKGLVNAPLARKDPPFDNRHCISPKYYPEYFGEASA
ncbi:MAG: hypothetical protein H7Z74_02980 [Anaerolineae bacterium]|nr:hypothetical protein [Gemmatimonadaceae bacterium]